MTTVGILNWQNETGLTNYPLTRPLVSSSQKAFPKNFIVDASFVQFDNTIPQLTSVEITDAGISVTLKVDRGLVSALYTQSMLTAGTPLPLLLNSRKIGKLVFGDSTQAVLDDFKGEVVTSTQPFLSCTVRGIPSTAGVFSIDGMTGVLDLESQDSLFFFVNGQKVTMNAVYVPAPVTANYLKTINQVHPQANNLLLLGSDTVNINPVGQSALAVNLISTPATVLPSTI